MNQSALIGGALLAGFALFIASRNRLSVYGRVLWGAKPDSHNEAAQEQEAEKALPGPLDMLRNYGHSDIPALPGPLDIFNGLHLPSIPDLGYEGGL